MRAPGGDHVVGRAVRFAAPFRVEVADVAVPAPKAGEVLVRAEYSGISGGTEMLAYRGELDSSAPRDTALAALAGSFEYPFRYGYSAVGTVERSMSEFPEGARVFAFHPHQDVFVTDVRDVVPVGGNDARAATLFPLVETALQVSLDAGVRYGETVAVLGLGPVGILTALVLQKSGARVVGTDVKDWRRQVAGACGLEAVLPEELAEAVDPDGADFLVEATGNPDVLGERLALLRDEGVALVCSWYGTKPVTLPLGGDFHRRRLEIRSSQVSTIGSRSSRWSRTRRLAVTQELLGELPVSLLATHVVPFDRAPEAYAALDRGDDGLVHVALAYA